MTLSLIAQPILLLLVHTADCGSEDPPESGTNLVRRFWSFGYSCVDVGNDVVTEETPALFSVHVVFNGAVGQ
ncbi:hypothetical protein [Streptomyces achromogenes]|uniref:hypothetical protein n=1 Tax=Streptomyces achromogenes TaxID=67255 RepID=UPI003A7F70E4